MNHLDTLRRSIELTDAVLGAGPIDEAASSATTACDDFDVTALGDHLIDTHRFLLAAAGGTAQPTGETLAQLHAAVGAAAVGAWERRGTDGTIDVGGNELPADFGLTLHALEAFVHAWDLADALERPFSPDAGLVDAGWDAARTVISDDIRSTEPGAPYAPTVGVRPGDDDLRRLIAFCGRDPHRSERTSA